MSDLLKEGLNLEHRVPESECTQGKFEGFGWADFFFLGRVKDKSPPGPQLTSHPRFQAWKSSSSGRQCYLFIIIPTPLKIHAAIRTALNEGPPTSIGFHVTENLRELVWRGDWESMEAARSQACGPAQMWSGQREPHITTGESGGHGH